MDATTTDVLTKRDKLRKGLGIWTSYYRANPHRLAIDYLGMKWLRPFQHVLIDTCFRYSYTMIIASRGMGKSIIAAIVCVLKCILYPGIKICIVSGTRGQAANIIKKIVNDFMPKSVNLSNEIKGYRLSPSVSEVVFYNHSRIFVATAGETGRSERANMILVDEFVKVQKEVLDNVVRRFKAGQRTPNFFLLGKYNDHPKEPNTELYISSAYYASHYSFVKFKDFFRSMVGGRSYCAMGFPYQLPVSEGYYPLDQIKDEMMETDWDSVSWSMEMDSLFFGQSKNAFYSFDEMNNSRKILTPIYPKNYYSILRDSSIKCVPKKPGEKRILAVDVATKGSKKSDATCISVLQMVPYRQNQFLRNLVFLTTLEGGHTFQQALTVRRMFDDFDCDYVAIDTIGVGIGVFDNLVQDQADDERATVYSAWSCVNDESLARRCANPEAPKIIYAIKGSVSLNSECAVSLRDAIRNGKFKLLISEQLANERLSTLKSFNSLPVEKQVLFQEPYYQTTAFINEAINLSFEVLNGGQIRVSNDSGTRKDRFSSVAYANYLAGILERKNRAAQETYAFQTFIN